MLIPDCTDKVIPYCGECGTTPGLRRESQKPGCQWKIRNKGLGAPSGYCSRAYGYAALVIIIGADHVIRWRE